MALLASGLGMRFGFHVSIQGGLSRAPERARALGCDCLQIFSGSPRSWNTHVLPEEEVRLFRQDITRFGLWPCVIHAPYLLNLCAEDAALLKHSREALLEELRRALLIGAEYVVVHMGTRKTAGEDKALELMARSVDHVLARFGSGTNIVLPGAADSHSTWPGVADTPAAGPGTTDKPSPASEKIPAVAGEAFPRVTLLLENTSGGGGKLGYRFEHLAGVLKTVGAGQCLGVCLDTAHLFQAGYDMRTRHGLTATIREFESCLDAAELHLMHLNDSLTPLGSGYDRHWHIGLGQIGRQGFRRILHHPSFLHLPMIMETPKQHNDDDTRNMRAARRFSRPNPAGRLLRKISCNKRRNKGL